MYFFLLSSLLCILAAADQIVLSNGDRLTGVIIDFDGKRLQMKSELAGTVTVAWRAIASLATDQPLAVTLSDQRVRVGTLTTRNSTIEIHGEDGKLTVSRDDVHTL